MALQIVTMLFGTSMLAILLATKWGQSVDSLPAGRWGTVILGTLIVILCYAWGDWAAFIELFLFFAVGSIPIVVYVIGVTIRDYNRLLREKYTVMDDD